MPGENIQDWSVTAANNSNSDSSINWAEGQPRASVNNSSRSMMAAHAKQRNLQNSSIVTGGSANAQTFTSGVGYTAPIPTGLRVLLKIGPSLTNTGAATLEMDGLGAVAIKDQLGVALVGHELVEGARVEFIYDGTNWIVLGSVQSVFTTGDAKLTLKTVADIGWIMMDDGTIGSATSGASRANADAQALFTLLFNNILDAWAPILTSAGADTTRAAQTDAATAWAANCRMTLTKQLGRSFAVAGSGSGLTARPLGSTVGEETHAQSVAEMPSHAHNALASAFLLTDTGADAGPGGSFMRGVNYANTTALAGSGTPFNVMQPTAFWNVMIKL
jgi:Microcystin-dependent protein